MLVLGATAIGAGTCPTMLAMGMVVAVEIRRPRLGLPRHGEVSLAVRRQGLPSQERPAVTQSF
eukprot:3225311-Pyramimonas_sp.AAC.1